MTEGQYSLATGADAIARLALVQAVHGPATRAMAVRAGLRAGMAVVDLGCGTGEVTRMLADLAGDQHVIGVDSSAAQVEAAAQRFCGISFRCADAACTGLPAESADVVFGRFLLMHVAGPAAVLAEAARLLRPGAVLAIEDGDFRTLYTDPPSADFDSGVSLYAQAVRNTGADSTIGARLVSLVTAAGFHPIQVALDQPAYVAGPEKQLPYWTVCECLEIAAARGDVQASEARRVADSMAAIASDGSTMVAMARMTQVIARKPNTELGNA